MQTLPARHGPRPTTSTGMPHSQLDQQPVAHHLRDALAQRVFALPGVSEQPSGISVPGARALVLDPDSTGGPPEAFLVGREFAHLHPGADHSLHLCLPEQLAEEACQAGWAELHPVAASGGRPRTLVMVYAPRDDEELRVVARLVEASYRFASGCQDTVNDAAVLDEQQTEGDYPAASITAFRHIGLTVTDLDRSVAWYTNVLGFQELFRESQPDRSAVILRLPDAPVMLGLVKFPAAPGDRFTPQRTGLDHLCFAVSSREDLHAWTARLDRHGVPHSGIVGMATSPIVNFKDPDGIALALALLPRSLR